MKIAILSKADRTGGGASRVAEDLTYVLRNNGYYVDHFTRSESNYSKTIPLYTPFEKKIYHRLLDVGIQEYYPFERKVINLYEQLNNYDLFHFHDITSTISPLTIKYLSEIGKKIIWTIHDCSVVTGGCIYPLSCEKYKNSCKLCPQLGSFGLGRNIDFTSVFHRMKKNVLRKSNIHFISPSKWIADFVYNTGYIKNYPTIISNGVNTDLFLPIDKYKAREELHLPQNRFIILITSNNLANKYKGIIYAIETIQKLKELNPFILIVGTENIDIKSALSGFDFYCTGFIEEQKKLNMYYSSANIFLNTTIADNQPLAVLEVMASGTPNIGFATGGIKEIIQNDIDGYITNNHNILDLVKRIKFLNENPIILNSMSKNASYKISLNYSLDKFSDYHIKLYKSMASL